MDDKKRDAAEAGTICDTNEDMNLTKNIIAQAIRQGKSAAYLKRDGWTMMPQLPTEGGSYLQIRRRNDVCYYWMTTWIEGGLLKKVEWEDLPPEDKYGEMHIVAWRKLPEIPEWAKEEVEDGHERD